ncbi:Phosphoenolpyruvate-dependent sugar phosphotransferase system, EI component [Mycoplasma haemocanis str. Illinois]|uniref:Phosphoenolpyruvate-protein phosphotransferase n=1 Tax=Mycoplasma haemocanis (strain Illinois) TaxID=1111676 RepID=H6N5J5_MYCHN|nr:phosphoenolpyruvate--protein phosphotransferase [Mycoplasma haemocanis]AEW44955.1 Phosphoenolpyruvate-dependent sugar phosphotransferase system, EI component [Mycoplasma haemocanis str. Illinois]
MSKKFKGIGIGEGVSVAKAFILKEPEFKFDENSALSIEKELSNYDNTLNEASLQMQKLIETSTKNISAEKGEIFQAHLEIIKDEQIQEEVRQLIHSGKSEAWSISNVFDKYQSMFESMADAYFKERASDIKDLKKRLLSISLRIPLPDLLLIHEECIIIAHDLSPSETAILDKKYIKGFATNIGGATSHSAIMARTLEIPALVSLKNITSQIQNGDLVALDAKEGVLESDLSEEDKKAWESRKQNFEREKVELEKYKILDCTTKDGVSVSIKGNIGQPKDLKKVIEYGGKGVGLFRSEFLYMESQDWPTEEEQFSAYKEVLEGAKGEEVVIRTLDIGGDKHLNYFQFPKEMNPFLGYRAIRLSLDKEEIFVTQLRALLRASVFGNLKIMFPMITCFEEFLKAKSVTKKVEEELTREGVKIGKYKLGMMVEVPSAAVLSSIFSREAEFFSVGSNDLIQYTHAVDRMSEEVNYLYQPNSPSILNLIHMTVLGANENNREVSVCGEMASNISSAILLIGLGVKSLSMSATAIPSIKRAINKMTLKECQEIAQKALKLSTEAEVQQAFKEFVAAKGI